MKDKKDHADHSPGYSANGESKYTRRSAAGGAQPNYDHETQTWSKLDIQIRNELQHVTRLERRVAEATDPAKTALALERLGKTRRFLDRLRNEQKAMVPDAPTQTD